MCDERRWCWWQAVAGDGGGGLQANAGGRAAAAVVQLLQGTRTAAEVFLSAMGAVAGDERWWQTTARNHRIVGPSDYRHIIGGGGGRVDGRPQRL